MDRGQAAAAVEWGMLTEKQVAGFRPDAAWLTGVFGGYLYGNVTAARSAVARSPGLTVELVDTQMFGLSDAPPHRRGKGERDPRAAIKTVTRIARSMRRPDDSCLRTDQADVARYAQSQPDIASASNDELIAVARSMAPWTERMMHHLLSTSSAAGISRSMLERTVASLGDAGLENRLTAGLGTIESAEPPRDAWRLGRLVAGDATLTALFDEGLDDLDARLRTSTGATSFVTELDAFSARHGARGPDEWELASPTWGSDPAIALAMIDRLRHAPEDRRPCRREPAPRGRARGAGSGSPQPAPEMAASPVRHRHASDHGARAATRGDEGCVRPCPVPGSAGARRAGSSLASRPRRLLPLDDRRGRGPHGRRRTGGRRHRRTA